MSKHEKILGDILRGNNDTNISFLSLCHLLQRLGFAQRIKGSHHIFTRENMEEIINIQSEAGKAKPYQVKQVRDLILKYKLGGGSYG